MQPAADRQYRNVFYEALAGADSAARDADPVLILASLSRRAASIASGDPNAAAAIDNLSAVSAARDLDAAVAAAQDTYESPHRFAEAIFFARCLQRDAAAALSLLQALRYVEQASVPASLSDLSTDRAAVLDAVGFAALWQEPARLEWMTSTLGIWRREYVAAYTRSHAAYHTRLAQVAEAMDAVSSQAVALQRLNGLNRLGLPLGEAALAQFRELERLFACPLAGAPLSEALQESPRCPECDYGLGDEAPLTDARLVQRAVERALAGQQARLAQRVVSRLLSQPTDGGEERLQRFIQVVQASDLSGLANVLDDSLTGFLALLLDASDATPGVLSHLSSAYPEVTAANLDDAVAAFRRLVEAELAAGAASVRLDQP